MEENKIKVRKEELYTVYCPLDGAKLFVTDTPRLYRPKVVTGQKEIDRHNIIKCWRCHNEIGF